MQSQAARTAKHKLALSRLVRRSSPSLHCTCTVSCMSRFVRLRHLHTMPGAGHVLCRVNDDGSDSKACKWRWSRTMRNTNRATNHHPHRRHRPHQNSSSKILLIHPPFLPRICHRSKLQVQISSKRTSLVVHPRVKLKIQDLGIVPCAPSAIAIPWDSRASCVATSVPLEMG